MSPTQDPEPASEPERSTQQAIVRAIGELVELVQDLEIIPIDGTSGGFRVSRDLPEIEDTAPLSDSVEHVDAIDSISSGPNDEISEPEAEAAEPAHRKRLKVVRFDRSWLSTAADVRRLIALISVGTASFLSVMIELDLVIRNYPVSELLEPLGSITAIAGIAIGFYFQERLREDDDADHEKRH